MTNDKTVGKGGHAVTAIFSLPLLLFQTILTACRRLPEIVENRGPQKQIEYGAYEARCFAEMLLKGSVVILEV